MSIRPISFTSKNITHPNTINANKTHSTPKSVSFGMTESEFSEKTFWELFEKLKTNFVIDDFYNMEVHARRIIKTPEFLEKISNTLKDATLKPLLKKALNTAMSQNIPK